MNRLFTFLLFLSCLAGLFQACGGSGDEIAPDEEEDAALSASPTTFAFAADGGAAVMTLTSNTVWVIDFSSSSWCRANIQTAQGNASVTLTADANTVAEERSATLTISATGAADVTITVNQAAKAIDPEDAEYIEPDQTGMRNLTALEFSKLMIAGWNLGNSLESINVTNNVNSGNETSWGNPVVTKTLIDAVKAAGFNAVRIPVAWSHSVDENKGYKIRSAWMQRVEEVVNYARDNDMYILINIHWDGGWLDHPDQAHQQAINTKLAALWKQIAIHLRDYDDHLLFAGTNEVHVDNNYDAPSTENVSVQNSFNQTFVNTVRATGGRNTYRNLVVQAFNTNIGYARDFMVMPTDPTPDRLFAEVHFYDPYDFALQEEGGYKTQWGVPFEGGDVSSWGQEAWVDEAFGIMKTNFTDRGIPVILGEYGALLRSALTTGLEEHRQARNNYLEYVSKKAKANGLVPFYWDNGNTGNNGFGLFNRSTGAVVHRDALNAIVNHK